MKPNYKEYAWSRMPWGKHKGRLIKDIPDDYLRWGIQNLDEGMATMFATELQRRHPELRKN